ncbi:flavin reductase family protein [Bosea psychrotolerans]|uniref:Flavin reductase (DIM6/NTAB) family NADH-FMN oxidoreductase RutF n=1 Tax=Bosea psychrotolerans TaxID=1871628 RepID=A0A2S4MQ90_9HYPH|nr:flavin reductase family protein [Bosea psychrotolerans]POR56916.1 flavin reductase (DIM6/NTAB) family NADH-FMN oxidoreductase RutF [Bosea psychrotolerans]
MTDFTAAFADLEPRERYKLLCASVTPRPIALVTCVSPEGVVNAAPFSFFNVFSEDPALVVLGLQHGPGNRPKDTTRHIAAAGEFVVNLVDEGLAEAMNICAIDFPPEVSEINAAGLSLLPGVSVAVPRIAEAPFALECRKQVSLAFSPTRELLVGEVVRIHARAGLVDPKTLRVSMSDYKPVGRMFGDGYSRQNDRFDLRRDNYAGWLTKRG